MMHRLLTIGSLILVLAACEAPKGSADYRENNPITVSEELLTMAIIGDARNLLAPGERRVFERLIKEYHMRGQGPVTIQVKRRGVAADARLASEDRVRQLLRDAGVPGDAIAVMPVEADKGAVAVVSFMANKLEAPTCGDWSVSASYNWSNRVQPNFGCATQRNIGLNIADPGDLKSARTMSDLDGNQGMSILRTYRGEAPAAAAGAGAAAGAAGGEEGGDGDY